MADKTSRIAILHHVGGGNLGDQAAVHTVSRNILARLPNAEIVVLSMNPEDTAQREGLPALPLRSHAWTTGYALEPQSGRSGVLAWLETTGNPLIRIPRGILTELGFLRRSWKILRTLDQVVVSGGGQMTDRSGPGGFPYTLFFWSLLARLAGVRFVLLNVGAGPLGHPLTRFFIRRALCAADYVSFRDQPSQKLAEKIGFRGESFIAPDNVYAITMPKTRPLAQPRPPVVGISPMSYPFCDPREHRGEDLRAGYEEYLDKFASFTSSLHKRSFSVELFGNDMGVDPSAIGDLLALLEHREGIHLPPYDPVDNLEGLLHRVASLDYVVTCRYHGVIFAHLLNKPMLAIAHHPKVSDLMADLGLSEYCFDIRTFTAAQLSTAFESLVARNADVKALLAEKLALYRSKLATQFDQLFRSKSQSAAVIQAGMSPVQDAALAGRTRL